MISSGEDLTKFNEGLTLVAKPDKGKFELGYGCDYWNGAPVVEGQTCTETEADAKFAVAYAVAISRAIADLGDAEYAVLSPQRQAVLNDMAYETGSVGLAGFNTMLAAVRMSDWKNAAQALKDSKLFMQVPDREERNMLILLTGDWP